MTFERHCSRARFCTFLNSLPPPTKQKAIFGCALSCSAVAAAYSRSQQKSSRIMLAKADSHLMHFDTSRNRREITGIKILPDPVMSRAYPPASHVEERQRSWTAFDSFVYSSPHLLIGASGCPFCDMHFQNLNLSLSIPTVLTMPPSTNASKWPPGTSLSTV